MIAGVGEPVPDTPHAVSVSLPSWKANVGYEEGEEWVVSKMKTGYPRFFIHLTIQELERELLSLYGEPDEKVMLFPSRTTSRRCQSFLLDKEPTLTNSQVRQLHLEPDLNRYKASGSVLFSLHCVFFPSDQFRVAKQFWQHSGDGVSSRRAEFCLQALRAGVMSTVPSNNARSMQQDTFSKGPRRYQRGGSQNNIPFSMNGHSPGQPNGRHTNGIEVKDCSSFVEERFGRNLNADLAYKAKLAIRRRICGCLVENEDLDAPLENTNGSTPSTAMLPCDQRVKGLSPDDVYLYPAGMSAIFNAHQLLMAEREKYGPPLQSICFGFPYIDTLKILQKWGPGCLFYGNGLDEDLDDLERRLKDGERFLGLFTEFPSNPLLRSPDLARIRKLADEYDFAVVVDETVGNYININVLSLADVVVSSLTKIFSGDSNVMGGSYVLNPNGRMYERLKAINDKLYEDNYWAEDAVFMERNSRDLVSRTERINTNAEAIATRLKASPRVKEVYWPKFVPSRKYYDACRTPNGGYGGLLSVTFKDHRDAVTFFDSLEVQKGPSLGTNFTLACPYAILAHYLELDWVEEYGVERDLVRISVGLEEPSDIASTAEKALDALGNH